MTGNKVLAIVGATASGKSDAAALLARRLNGEIINADSRLFYAGMEIGTARPSQAVLDSVPHHLVGFRPLEDPYSLAEFLVAAAGHISDMHGREKLPVIAGGTGQYVWGLLEGWRVPKVPPDPAYRAELELELAQKGVDALYARLKEQAPSVAAGIDGKNHRRVIRALERVAAGAGQEAWTAVDPGYDALVIGLHVEREMLHRRIVERIDRMLSSGWVDEVQKLVDGGVDFSAPALSAIGFREIAESLAGECTLDEARERTIRATNRLVRHQNNWFKRSDPRVRWIDVTDGDLGRVVDPVEAWVAK